MRIFFLFILCLSALNLYAQDSPAIVEPDTTLQPVARTDSERQITRTADTVLKDSASLIDSSLLFVKENRPAISQFKLQLDSPLYKTHPFFRFTNPMKYSITIKKWQGKEAIFYSIIVLLLFFALIKNSFTRYIYDLFRTYFQTTIKQKQIKEQLLQNPLPSLLLNLFFSFSGGMFLALLLQYFNLATAFNFWLLYLYCVLGLMTIYAVKFIFLKFFGWTFQLSEATDSYIFIVFSTNKIIGISLLPFLVLLALTYGAVNQAAMTISIIVVLGLLVYRFFLSYLSVSRIIRLSVFHFFLYLFAFELIPLLLINKLLFRFLGETP